MFQLLLCESVLPLCHSNQQLSQHTGQKNTDFISNCCIGATKNKLQRNTRAPSVKFTFDRKYSHLKVRNKMKKHGENIW